MADEKMRQGMIEGLEGWADAPPGRGEVLERIEHPGWTVEQIHEALGVAESTVKGHLSAARKILREISKSD